MKTDNIAELSLTLFQEAVVALTGPSGGPNSADRPAWLPVRDWQDACRLRDRSGDRSARALASQLGPIEDWAYVEASRRHRCRSHPDGAPAGQVASTPIVDLVAAEPTLDLVSTEPTVAAAAADQEVMLAGIESGEDAPFDGGPKHD